MKENETAFTEIPTPSEAHIIRTTTPIPSGWRRLPAGEIRQDGDKYLDTALFAGQWRPVNVFIGLPVGGELDSAVVIRPE